MGFHMYSRQREFKAHFVGALPTSREPVSAKCEDGMGCIVVECVNDFVHSRTGSLFAWLKDL